MTVYPGDAHRCAPRSPQGSLLIVSAASDLWGKRLAAMLAIGVAS
jgi:hypothetical protein